jgi:hypothetical protein
MRSKFPSLKSLKEFYPDYNPFYTQSWVYSGIVSYFGQQNNFDKLEFTQSKEEIDLIISDYQGNQGFRSGTDYHGLVFEGHVDYWTKKPIPPGTTLISGHEHFDQNSEYTSLGFDYWDVFIYNEFRSGTLYHEINRTSVDHAQYDVVLPVGAPREQRLTFLKTFNETRGDLTVVTDDRQQILETNLRFSNLGIEVYLNKVGIDRWQPYYYSPSIYDSNSQRSLDHMPHKRMHSIARVNTILETTVYNTTNPYLTEKTYKVLAQHRPFVVFGDTNILKKLKDQGFKTFDKYCDESYDTIADPKEKSYKASEAIKQLVESCKKYPDEIDSICRHNQEVFFSQERHANNLAKFGQRFLEIVK